MIVRHYFTALLVWSECVWYALLGNQFQFITFHWISAQPRFLRHTHTASRCISRCKLIFGKYPRTYLFWIVAHPWVLCAVGGPLVGPHSSTRVNTCETGFEITGYTRISPSVVLLFICMFKSSSALFESAKNKKKANVYMRVRLPLYVTRINTAWIFWKTRDWRLYRCTISHCWHIGIQRLGIIPCTNFTVRPTKSQTTARHSVIKTSNCWSGVYCWRFFSPSQNWRFEPKGWELDFFCAKHPFQEGGGFIRYFGFESPSLSTWCSRREPFSPFP